MAITHTKLDSGVNSAATGAQNTASVTIPENRWALVFVTTQSNSVTHAVTGTGLTGDSAPTVVRHGLFNTTWSLSIHKILGPAGGFTGALTITPSAGILSIAWCVSLLDGLTTEDPIVQNPVINTGTGTAIAGPTLNAARSADSKVFGACSHNVFQGLAADSGMTEICDHPGNSGAQSFQVSWSDAGYDSTPSTTAATSGNWGYLAIEVDVPVPAPPGGILPQVWDGAVWITADAVWTWDGAAWVEGTLHAYDGVDWQ